MTGKGLPVPEVTTAMCGTEAMPTAEDYKERGNKFTGKVRKVTVELMESPCGA